MAGEIIPFAQLGAQGGLAAYLDVPEFAAALADQEQDITIYASFPQISLKGKAWTVVQGDERKVMMKPDGSGEQVQTLEGVFLRINDKARTYFKGEFKEGAENVKPTCYSNDGVAPSDRSVEKQSAKCATCPWAVFGSARQKDGTAGKGTACSQRARIAFAAPGALDKPHLLSVPPTSLRPLRDAIDAVKQRKIPYPVVLMKLGFVAEEASPVLRILPAGLLSKEDGIKAIGYREDSTVRAICGLDDLHVEREALPAPPPAEPGLASGLDAALAERAAVPTMQSALDSKAPTSASTPPAPPATPATPTVTATPAPPATPAPVIQPTVAAATPAPAAVVQPTIAPSKPQVTVAKDNLLGELGDLLGNLDG